VFFYTFPRLSSYDVRMATKQSTADYLVDQLSGAGAIRSRKMFGEYALYCDEKVIALLCDDQLFVKPTDAGRALIGEPEEAPPYPGAKPHFLIPEERWEEREWLSSLVAATAESLPKPKKKKST
jgi:TfoX/Sxy family transcriptional regulator of competence genes